MGETLFQNISIGNWFQKYLNRLNDPRHWNSTQVLTLISSALNITRYWLLPRWYSFAPRCTYCIGQASSRLVLTQHHRRSSSKPFFRKRKNYRNDFFETLTSASTRSRAAVWARGRFFKREHKLETINATSNPTHRYGPWTPQIISHTPTPKPTLYCWFLFASDTLLEFHFSPSFLACNISIPIPHRFPPFTSPLSPSPPSPLTVPPYCNIFTPLNHSHLPRHCGTITIR